MALNLGSPAFEAAQRLKHTEDWKIIVDAMVDQTTKLMHAAVETGSPDHCGYARGVRDVLWAMQVMEAGADAPLRATQKPALRSGKYA